MNGKRYGRGLIAAFSALVAVVAIILAVFVISGDEADLTNTAPSTSMHGSRATATLDSQSIWTTS